MIKLADLIPGYDREIGPKGTMLVMSSAGLVFAGLIVLLYTLERLGMPGRISTVLALGAITISICLVSWFGRSVSGPLFFDAGRQGESLPVGLGGAFCWLGGAAIVTLFALPQGAQFILVGAMMLGLALQAFLFANPIHVSDATTLPGLMVSSLYAKHTVLICLAVCIVVLCPVIAAEFSVARNLFATLSGWSLPNATLTVCVLASLPTLLGGWRATFLVNMCIGMWVVFSILAPALIVGFVPTLIAGSSGPASPILVPLVVGSEPGLILADTPGAAAVSIAIFAAGFAAMPHALARLPLTSVRIAAVEGLGWTGLVIFLSLSALLLSVGLILTTGAETRLGQLLQSSAALATLPYIAVFLAAFNALIVSIFVAANTVIRTVRYYRNREPGVGSMFAVRLLVIALAIAIWFSMDAIDFAAPKLLLSALSIAAAGLFSTLVFTFWVSRMPALAVSAAMLAGTVAALTGIVTGSFDIATSGALGVLASLTVLCGGRLLHRPKMVAVSPGTGSAAV